MKPHVADRIDWVSSGCGEAIHTYTCARDMSGGDLHADLLPFRVSSLV